jgi:hypothetical protein
MKKFNWVPDFGGKILIIFRGGRRALAGSGGFESFFVAERYFKRVDLLDKIAHVNI